MPFEYSVIPTLKTYPALEVIVPLKFELAIGLVSLLRYIASCEPLKVHLNALHKPVGKAAEFIKHHLIVLFIVA